MPAKKRPRRDPMQVLDTHEVNAVSATDCTGLIPSPPETHAELSSYGDLYTYEANIAKRERKEKE